MCTHGRNEYEPCDKCDAVAVPLLRRGRDAKEFTHVLANNPVARHAYEAAIHNGMDVIETLRFMVLSLAKQNDTLMADALKLLQNQTQKISVPPRAKPYRHPCVLCGQPPR